jgi:hypothetical protein
MVVQNALRRLFDWNGYEYLLLMLIGSGLMLYIFRPLLIASASVAIVTTLYYLIKVDLVQFIRSFVTVQHIHHHG